MGEGETAIVDYLDAADTRSTLDAVAGARRPGRGRRRPESTPAITIHGVGLRGAEPAEIDVGNAGTLLRLLPGWLAGQRRRGLDARRRRLDPAPAGRPGRRAAAADGRELSLPRGAAAAAARSRARRCAGSPTSCRSRAPRSSRACCFAGLLAEGETRVVEPAAEPRPHRADAGRRRAPRSTARRTTPSRSGPPSGSSRARSRSPATSPRPPSSSSPRSLVPGSEVALTGVGHQPDPHRPARRSSSGWGPTIEVEPTASAAASRSAILRVRAAELRATEVGGAEVPLAIDELPLVALAACFAEGDDDDPRRRRAAPQGVRPDRDRLRRR